MAGDLPDVYLRFEKDPDASSADFIGSCMDSHHPGQDSPDPDNPNQTIKGGWISIKNFSFGFGFPGKDKDAAQKKKKAEEEKDKAKSKDKTKTKSEPTQGMTSGPMTFDPIKFAKSADLMSHDLMKACKSG